MHPALLAIARVRLLSVFARSEMKMSKARFHFTRFAPQEGTLYTAVQFFECRPEIQTPDLFDCVSGTKRPECTA